MKHSRTCLVLALFSCLTGGAEPGKIKHRFVATDESGHQVLLVDEAAAAGNWAVPLHARDMQLVGDGRLMVSVNTRGTATRNGYLELSLDDGRLLKRFESPAGMFKRVTTARRGADGNAVNLSGQNAMAPVAAQAVSAILAVSQVGAEQCKPASKE
ncbi:MAG: hypothetical protein HN742_13115 [Lentisphaerae bacterium]|nr:hypothetical protein [Lentisphaerota bacterium]